MHDRFEHSLNLISTVAGSPETYRNGRTVDNPYGLLHRHRYSPYGSSHSQSTPPVKEIQRRRSRQHSYHVSQPRGMLQRKVLPLSNIIHTNKSTEAWHAISIDPLVDSDDEMGGDEYVRDDYGMVLPTNHRKTPTEIEL